MIVVVTGASSGLGALAARAFEAAGAQVITGSRRGPGRRLDLADLASVRAFAAGIDTEIDVLLNNAGVMAAPAGTTRDGFEIHLGTNHLGHFALTGLLLDRIRGRVVTVTSGLHVLGRTDRRARNPWLAYADSKLANLLFACELHRRGGPLSVAAHPGLAATEGQRAHTSLQGKVLAGGRAQSPERGVLPLLHAATAPDVAGGTCIGPDGLLQRHGDPAVVRTSRRSRDPELAARLWERSEELTGVRYLSDARSGR